MIKSKHIPSKTNTIECINKFCGKTFLIKLGGSILDNTNLIKSVCNDLKVLKKAGIKIIIVHGGSKAINKYLSINKIKTSFADGLRVTSLGAMNIIEMVLCGHVNKSLVRTLNSIDITAIGLSGTDSNMLLCNYYSKNHGYVGVINSVNTNVISHFMLQQEQNFDAIPVIAPVGVDIDGNPMNINADYAASKIASALNVDKLIYLTDQDGIYDKSGHVYSKLNSNELIKLINNKTVKEGMLTKIKSILAALNDNLNYIHILNGNTDNILIKNLFTNYEIGTVCENIKPIKQLEAVA